MTKTGYNIFHSFGNSKSLVYYKYLSIISLNIPVLFPLEDVVKLLSSDPEKQNMEIVFLDVSNDKIDIYNTENLIVKDKIHTLTFDQFKQSL